MNLSRFMVIFGSTIAAVIARTLFVEILPVDFSRKPFSFLVRPIDAPTLATIGIVAIFCLFYIILGISFARIGANNDPTN